MHALHGNGPPQADNWRQVRGGQTEAKWLQEPQTVAKLRAAGWQLPPHLSPDYMLRVYDTRLDDVWLRGLVQGISAPEHMVVVGGDFLTKPAVEDSIGLNPLRLTRWGPADLTAYHIVVPPRPHQASWLTRAHQQVALEGPQVEFSICCIVPRDQCAATLDSATIRRLIPSSAPILDDPNLEVEVLAVGERPPLVRVPAHNDVRQLPPTSWESAFLAVNRVLLLLRFRRMPPNGCRFATRWIKGDPPKPSPSNLELLRMEMILPPALQQSKAEQAARRGLRQLATALQLPEPPPHQLRQLQVQHGLISGILGVPVAQAREWLRGSGCCGLYLRPFWTNSTGEAVARHHFHVHWLRGHIDKGPKLWQALWDKPGVFGLIPSGRDVGVRISTDTDLTTLEPHLRFGLDDQSATFRRGIPGQRWWRLGPLTEAEAWHAKDLIALTGLEPIRGELRFAQAGPFRRNVYFSAVGEPRRYSLDDGSWNGSAASLQISTPPPRHTSVARHSFPRPSNNGPALTSLSTWGGARQTSTTASPFQQPALVATSRPSVSPSLFPPLRSSPASRAVPHPTDHQQALPADRRRQRRPSVSPVAPELLPSPPPTIAQLPPRRSRGSPGRSRPLSSTEPSNHFSPATDRSAHPSSSPDYSAQLNKLFEQIAILTQTLQAVQAENAELRRLLASAQRQAVAPASSSSALPSTPRPDAIPIALPLTHDHDMGGSPDKPDPKRTRSVSLGGPPRHDL